MVYSALWRVLVDTGNTRQVERERVCAVRSQGATLRVLARERMQAAQLPGPADRRAQPGSQMCQDDELMLCYEFSDAAGARSRTRIQQSIAEHATAPAVARSAAGPLDS